MLGDNKIIGARYFNEHEEAKAGKLKVSSLFFTIQGEGPLQGQPSVFIRLSHCNLSCSFCDASFEQGEWMALQDLDKAIDECIKKFFDGKVPPWARQCDIFGDRAMNVVMTGGEPMLQKNIVDVVEYLAGQFQRVQIETNGLIYREMHTESGSLILVVSPKCVPRKGGLESAYSKPIDKVMKAASCFKFLLSADDSSPYHEVPEWALRVHGRVYVSPINVYNKVPDGVASFWTEGLLNLEEVRRNHEYAAQYALRHGLRLSLQQHLFAAIP